MLILVRPIRLAHRPLDPVSSRMQAYAVVMSRKSSLAVTRHLGKGAITGIQLSQINLQNESGWWSGRHESAMHACGTCTGLESNFGISLSSWGVLDDPLRPPCVDNGHSQCGGHVRSGPIIDVRGDWGAKGRGENPFLTVMQAAGIGRHSCVRKMSSCGSIIIWCVIAG